MTPAAHTNAVIVAFLAAMVIVMLAAFDPGVW